MATFIFKTEPSTYSFQDLVREGRAVWDGITNNAALGHLREMPKGAKLVIYHTGDEKRVVGTATVESVDATDPKAPQVRIKAGKAIKSPKSLADIKGQKMFQDSPLVTVGRLSVVPLTEAQWKWLVGE